MSDLLGHLEAIWQSVAPDLPGLTVEMLPSVDSTNSELMRRARTASLEPVLLVAQVQTAGRGRLGKGWHSEAGKSLTFSLALPLAVPDWSGLSLAVGVSLACSLHPKVGIKWPNDLWLEQRKLGGILVETAGSGGAHAPRTVVIGVGINLGRPDIGQIDNTLGNTLPAACSPAASPAGLHELFAQMTAGQALARVAAPLVRDMLRFGQQGFDAFVCEFDRRDVLKGKAVRLSDGSEGIGAGVTALGALQIQTAQGLHQIHSAQVSVRPC